MKRLLQFLSLLALLLLLSGIGLYFLLTNSRIQQQFVASKLPAGSSVQQVQIGLHSIELHGLKIQLSDGTKIQIKSARAGFALLTALLEQRLELEQLQLSGLQIDHSTPSGEASFSPSDQIQNWQAQLAALDQFAWPLVVSEVQAQGQLILNNQQQLEFTLASDQIAPGQTTTVQVQSTAHFAVAHAWIQGPLQTTAVIKIHQKASNGFDTLELESTSKTQNLQAQYSVKIHCHPFTAQSSAELQFEIPASPVRPPILAALTPVSGHLALQADLKDNVIKLTAAELTAQGHNRSEIRLKLSQPVTSENYLRLREELLQIHVSDFQLSSLNPWLEPNYSLQAAPLQLSYTLSQDQAGNLQLTPDAPLALKQVQIMRGHSELVHPLDIQAAPTVQIRPDHTIQIRDETLKISDAHGPILSARTELQFNPLAPSNYQGEIAFEIDAVNLLKQPALAGKIDCLSANLVGHLRLDSQAPFPIQMRATLEKFKTRAQAYAREIRFQIQANASDREAWAYKILAETGYVKSPSSQLELSGTLNPSRVPLQISSKLTSTRLAQKDIEHLLSARKSSIARQLPMLPGMQKPRVPAPAAETSPSWPEINATVQAELARVKLSSGFELEAIQFESEIRPEAIELRNIQVQLDHGSMSGQASSQFNPEKADAFTSSLSLQFDQIDPRSFERPGRRIPLHGKFNGELNAAGSGPNFLDSWQQGMGQLQLHASEGRISAFQLNRSHSLGMAGAELAGLGLSSLLQNDQINTTTQSILAIIPYFQEIEFDQFELTLNRSVPEAIDLTELNIQAAELQIQATGVIAANPLSKLLHQPMQIDLSLSSRGPMLIALQNLDLVTESTDTSHFTPWNEILPISGSLSAPDTSAITELLTRKAQSAMKLDRSSPLPKQLIDEVKNSFEALESLFAP